MADENPVPDNPPIEPIVYPRDRRGDPGVPMLRTLPDPPTTQDLISAVKDYDGALAAFLQSTLETDNIPTISAPYAGALDPLTLTRWLRDVASANPEKIAVFMAEQAVLYAMNPTVARVFNPAYLAAIMVPYSMGHLHTTIDTQGGLTMEAVVRAQDALFEQTGDLRGLPGRDQNVYADDARMSDGQDLSVDLMFDRATGGGSFADVPLSLAPSIGGQVARYDASACFETRPDVRGASRIRPSTVRGDVRFRVAAGVHNVADTALARSAAVDGIVRVPIEGELWNSDDYDGTVSSTTHDPSGPGGVDDDAARVPLSFTDLRPSPGKRFRTVYFQPLNLNINESMTPEYAEAKAFGRTDPAVSYTSTTRTLSLSFDVQVFAAEDLELAYKKLTALRSMVYPTYGQDGVMRSGPLVKLRVGDLVRGDDGGLPGVIRSLSFDYSDSLWELAKGLKVPRSIAVSLDYLVLHEGPVGTVDGVFGVLTFPDDGAPVAIDTKMLRAPRRT